MLLLAAVCADAPAAGQQDARGLFEDAHLQMQNRLVYEQLDYRNGSSFRAANGQRGKTRAVESAYGLMFGLQSGYTPGVLGVGLDAHAYGAVNLGTDAGNARYSPRYLAKDEQAIRDTFGRAGAALKLRVSATEFKWGELRTSNPIFHSSDTRLLPETNRGWLLTSTDVPTLALQGGRFTAWADRNSVKNGNALFANYSGKTAGAFSFAGGAWTAPLPGLSLSAYLGQLEDNWNTLYLGGFYKHVLADKRALSFNLNRYQSIDAGQARSGKLNTTAWSLMTSYILGAHKFGLGYQKIDGDNPFDYVNRGSIWLDNAMQLSDFNAPGEASWQLRYDADLSALVAPGLKAGLGYVRGSGIDYRRMNGIYAGNLGYKGSGGRHWERDLILAYTVQEGKAKGLVVQLRYSTHRANKAQGEPNVDQVRLLVEMPVSLF
ncbi:OprD family outer membrane porin [Herbaspirillum sp. LeCh32-8]|uniref:OprD family outer membrane porin n=1 Tax=Herbaspirillum sp. LeCh32-8 TaxID=2821356 RepID=UPI0032AEF567